METWRPVLFVGLGGFLGSVARYLLGGWVQDIAPAAQFPWATLLVNVLGCFGIGLIAGLGAEPKGIGADLRLFLVVGVLGGFTTFSSFAYDTLALAQKAEYLRALANVAAQVVLGLAVAALGYSLMRWTAR